MPSTQPRKHKKPMESEGVEGETVVPTTNKKDVTREPIALPPQKKTRIHFEASTDPHTSSQKDVRVEKVTKLFFDVFSQHNKSIEILRSFMVFVQVSPP